MRWSTSPSFIFFPHLLTAAPNSPPSAPLSFAPCLFDFSRWIEGLRQCRGRTVLWWLEMPASLMVSLEWQLMGFEVAEDLRGRLTRWCGLGGRSWRELKVKRGSMAWKNG